MVEAFLWSVGMLLFVAGSLYICHLEARVIELRRKLESAEEWIERHEQRVLRARNS